MPVHYTGMDYEHELPRGRRFFVCANRVLIESYAGIHAARAAVRLADHFYAKHGMEASRSVFEFVPGIGFIYR